MLIVWIFLISLLRIREKTRGKMKKIKLFPFTCLTLYNLQNDCTYLMCYVVRIFSPTLQIKQLKLRADTRVAQSYAVSKKWSWTISSVLLS